MPRRRPSLAAWTTRHLRPTDGPGTGARLALEPWQRGFLQAVDREQKSNRVSLMAAAQVGKSLLALGIAIRAAVDGSGMCCWRAATEVSVRDLASPARQRCSEHAPNPREKRFPSPRSGTRGSRVLERSSSRGGWVDRAGRVGVRLAARQSERSKIALADEVSRWPARVRSGEGSPDLALIRARVLDWGDDGLIAGDLVAPSIQATRSRCCFETAIAAAWSIVCPGCDHRTPFGWEQVVGRDRGEQPMIACLYCGTLHDERARRRMLRSGVWVPQKSEPTDEGSISFQLGRLDSAQRLTRGDRCRSFDVPRGDRSGAIRAPSRRLAICLFGAAV